MSHIYNTDLDIDDISISYDISLMISSNAGSKG